MILDELVVEEIPIVGGIKFKTGINIQYEVRVGLDSLREAKAQEAIVEYAKGQVRHRVKEKFLSVAFMNILKDARKRPVLFMGMKVHENPVVSRGHPILLIHPADFAEKLQRSPNAFRFGDD